MDVFVKFYLKDAQGVTLAGLGTDGFLGGQLGHVAKGFLDSGLAEHAQLDDIGMVVLQRQVDVAQRLGRIALPQHIAFAVGDLKGIAGAAEVLHT